MMTTGAESSPVLVMLERLLDAFNRHDLDAIMDHFADDCVMEMPRGPDPWGRRYIGKAQVREGLAGRFVGIPNIHYGDAHNWVCGEEFGVSDWTLTGTTTDGKVLRVRGCDHYSFRDGKVVFKDSYWKIVD